MVQSKRTYPEYSQDYFHGLPSRKVTLFDRDFPDEPEETAIIAVSLTECNADARYGWLPAFPAVRAAFEHNRLQGARYRNALNEFVLIGIASCSQCTLPPSRSGLHCSRQRRRPNSSV